MKDTLKRHTHTKKIADDAMYKIHTVFISLKGRYFSMLLEMSMECFFLCGGLFYNLGPKQYEERQPRCSLISIRCIKDGSISWRSKLSCGYIHFETL